MRVTLIADTHGFLDPRIKDVIADSDIAVHAGDVGGADVLLSMQPREMVVAIRGNNDVADKWPTNERNVLETMQREAVLDLPGGTLAVAHGDMNVKATERHQTLRERYPNARAVVYGHSHKLCVDQDDKPWVLNPGAAGRTRTYGGPACLVLHIRGTRWDVEEIQLPPRKYRAITA